MSSDSDYDLSPDDYRPVCLDYNWIPVTCYLPLIQEIIEEGPIWLVFNGTSRLLEDVPYELVFRRFKTFLHIRVTGYNYGKDTSVYGYDEELGNVCFFPTAIQRMEWELIREIPTYEEARHIGEECMKAYKVKRNLKLDPADDD